jgi:type II secretory pathway component PulJ
MYHFDQWRKPFFSSGHTLLELMISLALGLALIAGLLTYMDHLQRHKRMINNQLSLQVAADLSLTVLLQDWRQSCGNALLAGQSNLKTGVWLQVERQGKEGCQGYEYRFFADQQSIKRRRLTNRSRYSPLLADINSMLLRFGVDSDDDCQLDRWLATMPAHDKWQVRQAQVTLQLQTWSGNWR